MGTVRASIKWIAISLGFDAVYFSAHSLTTGGPSTLFPNGVDLEITRRFGRLRSSDFIFTCTVTV